MERDPVATTSPEMDSALADRPQSFIDGEACEVIYDTTLCEKEDLSYVGCNFARF
jgi:hypothetical protein